MRSGRARSGGREGSHPLGQASQDRPPVTSGLLVQLAIIPDVNDRPAFTCPGPRWTHQQAMAYGGV